jgi:hypothetical protein
MAIRGECPPCGRRSRIAAGLHANLDFEQHELEVLATARAAQHGVAITGLSGFIAEGASERRAGLVVGYGRPNSARTRTRRRSPG